MTPVFAKFPSPELQEIYPAGGQVGSEIIVTVAGEGLEEIEALKFSNPGNQSPKGFITQNQKSGRSLEQKE